MASSDVSQPFHPLIKLNLPSPEEYNKRKVALISGMSLHASSSLRTISLIPGFAQALPAKMDRTCECRFNLLADTHRVGRVTVHSDSVLYRTELLLSKGYDVHGIIRRSSSFNTNRLQHLYEDQHERT